MGEILQIKNQRKEFSHFSHEASGMDWKAENGIQDRDRSISSTEETDLT